MTDQDKVRTAQLGIDGDDPVALHEAVQAELLACYGEGENTDWPWLNDLTDVVVGLIQRYGTAEQYAEYVLSPEDEMIARKVAEGVTAETLVKCRQIHHNAIATAQQRRDEIVRELQAIDRAITMRTLSLSLLAEQFDESRDARD